jgi:hypothetical protein
VFHDIFKLTMPQFAFGGLGFTIYSFKLETYHWLTLVNSPECPPTCPGGEASVPERFEPAIVNIDPALEPMRMQEFTVGVEHQLAPHVAVAARFIHKQLDRAVEDRGRGRGGKPHVRDRESWIPPCRRGHLRCAVSQGRPRLRCCGAGRAEAAGSQLGGHRELRLEPLIRQLLGPVAI